MHACSLGIDFKKRPTKRATYTRTGKVLLQILIARYSKIAFAGDRNYSFDILFQRAKDVLELEKEAVCSKVTHLPS